MQALLGIIFHFIGGSAAGSFYIPYKKIKGWGWESYWLVGGLFSWLIIPPIAAWLTIPHFVDIILQSSFSTIGWTYVWGLLWGIGGLTYGLGIRYLGMSLGNSVLLGFTAVFGALAPSVYYNFYNVAGKTTFHDLINTSWGRLILLGIIICLVGIIICGRAGVLKEKDFREIKKIETIKEFNLVKGLIVCTISGVLSACFNYGIEAGTPMAEVANEIWNASHPGENAAFLFRNNVIFVVLLWGGLTTNLIWCVFLNFRNNTFGDYANNKTSLTRNYFFAGLAGTIWFLQFFFYGMGESKLGNGASSWILHMAFIILVANIWGFVLNEWKGARQKTTTTIILGILTILLSVILVGYGNALK